ncbi:hypothetical protein JOD24_001205 [Kroppenstedtia sanguinis]|uniref:hypothetical protein n=1 Tax=Kroppenstedtia sanguinis TaxID=1380684 RepID=UPI003D23C15C
MLKGNPKVFYFTMAAVFFIVMGNLLQPFFLYSISVGAIGGFILIVIAIILSFRDWRAVKKEKNK